MTGDAQMLPGFDLATVVNESEVIADLTREKNYTAERLLVCHPDRYNIARGLFFELGLSKRAICELCKLNSRTLNALIERELNTHGADFLYERIRRKKALIAYQLTEQLEELAHDPKACKEAGINGLIQAIKMIQASAGQTIDVPPTSSSTSAENLEDVDYVKVYKLNSSHPNGFAAGKNSAPRVDKTPESAGLHDHCPADSGALSDDVRSILQSGGCQDLRRISSGVDNLVDSPHEKSDAGGPCEKSDPGSAPSTMGGGGTGPRDEPPPNNINRLS